MGLADRLAGVVGSSWVLRDPGETLPYECDGLTHLRCRPELVVLPGSSEEVAEVVSILHEERCPFLARGAGTGLSAGAVPPKGGVVVGLARLDRVLEIDPEERTAWVECGVTNAALGRAAEPYGLFYAPDPSSQVACTLGGNVAENSGGPHCYLYGQTVRHVLALKAVLADGTLVEAGDPLFDAPDPDLLAVLVGQEGTLAVVTEICVRLLPKPEAVRTLLAPFADVPAACRAVAETVRSGLRPSALEVLDGPTIEAVEASSYAAGYPAGAGAVLLVEFEGSNEEAEESAQRVRRLLEGLGALGVEEARDDVQRARLWKGRKGAFGALGRLAPDLYVQDAVVPRSALPEVIDRVLEIGRRFGVRLSNVFHAGDGNLHPNVSYDRRDEDETRRVVEAGAAILRLCVEAGGTLSGEHGIGLEKRDFLPLVFGPTDLEVQRRVKESFDPNGLLNPGKALPSTGGCKEIRSAAGPVA